MFPLNFVVLCEVTEGSQEQLKKWNFKYITRSDNTNDINEYIKKEHCLDNLHSKNEHKIVNSLHYGASWMHMHHETPIH